MKPLKEASSIEERYAMLVCDHNWEAHSIKYLMQSSVAIFLAFLNANFLYPLTLSAQTDYFG